MRRLCLSTAMLATGAALMATAQLSGAAPSRKAGVFKVATTGGSVQIDPQVSYNTTGWWLEYATAAKLYNWSEKGGPVGHRLVPEVASRFVVSNGGKRYTFFIRRGFRFSDGTRVTAASFKYAIDRVANHDLISPGAQFITDPNGTNIVGAQDVNNGHGTDVSGAQVRGNRLIVNLTRPDGSFVSKLTMPFFQATSRKLPLTTEVVNVNSIADLPSAGPYAFSLNEVNTTTALQRNPYWKRGPGRQRPRNLAGLTISWNQNEEQAYNQVLANQIDEGPLPVAHIQEVADRFGVNRTRFWALPVNCTGWLIFNNGRGLFKDNLQMRKAVNWAIDRTDYVAQVGPYAGSPWTHILPPGFPGSVGSRKLQPYGPRSNIPRAQRLAAGHFKDGRIRVLFRATGSIVPRQADLVRRDLIRLGFDPANIEMVRWYGYFPPPGFDLTIGMGWCADDPDPFTFFKPMLLNNSELPLYPTLLDPRYQRKVRAAAALVGPARLKAFGKLDLEIMRNLAPLAAMRTYNNRYFFSDRVDPRGLVYNHVYSDWSIGALALK